MDRTRLLRGCLLVALLGAVLWLLCQLPRDTRSPAALFVAAIGAVRLATARGTAVGGSPAHAWRAFGEDGALFVHRATGGCFVAAAAMAYLLGRVV